MNETRKWILHRISGAILEPLYVWLYFSLISLSTKNYSEAIYFFKNPLMTLRVIFGIHYQAMRIFFKGGKYYSRNKKPTDTISFEGRL